MRILFIVLSVFCLTNMAFSQTLQQNSGWLFLMNTTKISEKWGTHLDVQLRSADNWDYLRNFMFRPGITYSLNNNNDLTLGYLLNNTFSRADGTSDNTVTEHRIWQQYLHKHKIGSIGVSHRFRAEQRIIEKYGETSLFAQRARYFIRAMIPLKSDARQFEKGAFVALQNEAFVHLQNEDAAKIFDQNRAYVAAGYRLGKQLDLEMGYLNQTSTGSQRYTTNHVVQLAVYTRF
jgi:hypothetical protein